MPALVASPVIIEDSLTMSFREFQTELQGLLGKNNNEEELKKIIAKFNDLLKVYIHNISEQNSVLQKLLKQFKRIESRKSVSHPSRRYSSIKSRLEPLKHNNENIKSLLEVIDKIEAVVTLNKKLNYDNTVLKINIKLLQTANCQLAKKCELLSMKKRTEFSVPLKKNKSSNKLELKEFNVEEE